MLPVPRVAVEVPGRPGAARLRMAAWSAASIRRPPLVGGLGPKLGSRDPAGGRACPALLSPEVWQLVPATCCRHPWIPSETVAPPAALSHQPV